MNMQLLSVVFAILLLHEGGCRRKAGLFGKVSRRTNLKNKLRSNIEFMNENDNSNGFVIKPEWNQHYYRPYSARYYETPYRYQMIPMPYPYGMVPNPNWFADHYWSKDFTNNYAQPLLAPSEQVSNQHEHYLERFPESLTYEVTEHINTNLKQTTLASKDITTLKPNCFTEKATDIAVNLLEKNITINKTVETSTLASGPDVMLSDAVRVGLARSVRKRDLKAAVPVDVLFDGAATNGTQTDTNISQYLNRIFGDLDQHSVVDLIRTLKDEYLTSATSSESTIIEETFSKLAASFQNKNKRSQDGNDKIINNRNIDDKARAELLAKAAAALGLLAEETADETEDSMEDFLDDESYHDIYDHDVQFQSHEIVEDEAKEPSFLELLNIATKHKESKVSRLDSSI